MTEPEVGSLEHQQRVIDELTQRVQFLEDLVEELIEIALVNRAGLLASMKKKLVEKDELRQVYQRIEQAHEQAREAGNEYRILPAAGAYFLDQE